MARRPRTARPRPPANYRFEFLGFRDGWYVLRVDMSLPGERLEALAFEGRVTDFLVSQRITPGTWSHFGKGNTGDYPVLPTADTDLGLLLKRPADVLRLAASFPTTGITVETLHAALQAEARVHRFVVEDAAKIAHAAIRTLILTFGDVYPTWDELGGETRVLFMTQVRHRLEHPVEPADQTHVAWVDQRLKDKWKYGPAFSVEDLTDPLLVPWGKLQERDRVRYSLLASVVGSIAPLLA